MLILLLLALYVFLRARKHRGSAATKAIVILALVAAGVLHSTAAAPSASAAVSVDPALADAYSKCSGIFTGAGGDPSGILPTINAPSADVQIRPTGKKDQTHEISVKNGPIIIFWNPADSHPYVGGGNADPCTPLYHEMDHGYQDLHGGQDTSDCWYTGPDGKPWNSQIPAAEVQATREQNMLRKNLDLPERVTYGENPLPPPGPCQPPPPGEPKNCTESDCGHSNGDPHLTTFEGVRYDFQAAGEFVAADDPRGGFQIQVRQQPFPGSQTVTVNTAIALDVAGDRVQVGMSPQGLLVLVNGTPQTSATVKLPHGGSVTTGFEDTGETLTATWPDASTATIYQIGVWGLKMSAEPAAAHAGHLKGLLGDLGGSASGGVQTATGTTIANPSFSTLYPGFSDSWRVTAATSLFTYSPGTNTATYTDKSYPHAPVSLSSVPNLAAATAQCTNAGVTDPVTLRDCELDVGLTGESAFAAADSPPATENSGSFGIDGAAATVTIGAPGGSSALHFQGTAGQIVFVNVPKTTLGDQCDVLALNDPTGKELESGCLAHGSGYINTTKLPVTGTYTVQVGPTEKAASGATGSATVQLIQDFDQSGAIVPGGPPVTATIGQAGGTSAFTFTAPPGTAVSVQVVSTTLPAQCALPEMDGPNGTEVGAACTTQGSGFLDPVVIQASGTYTVLVDPDGPATGTAVLRAFVEHDQSAAITVGGPPVTATVAQPGGRSTLTFQGTAGETVTVRASASTMPGDCGQLQFYGPDGKEITEGCVVDGSGSIVSTKLPSTGQYSIVVDPGGASTGRMLVGLTAG